MEGFMNNEKDNIKISKFMSLVLRHKPETIGIVLDKNGWTDVEMLLNKLKEHGLILDKTLLEYIVATNIKKRFAFNDTHTKIRANQGHSVEIDLGYLPQKPPLILYHGTGEKYVGAILKLGLKKQNRHNVHLSLDVETALNVGQRHGNPIVFKITSGEMFNSGYEFFLSENGVWLTDFVPVEFLQINNTCQTIILSHQDDEQNSKIDKK
jgi:putative RNA 2'-phosphotransferase